MKEIKMIAKFAEWEDFSEFSAIAPNSGGDCWMYEDMKFDSSWDWLMPVVEKIENLGFEFFIVENRCKVQHNTDHSIKVVLASQGAGSKLEHTYSVVVEFIQWYNTQK